MNQTTLKLLPGTLTALTLACTAAREETRPTPPATETTARPAEPPSTPDEEWRYKRPDPLPVTPRFEPPVPVERKLKSGATVLVRENHALPLVAVSVIIRAGVNREPLNKAGLAGFTASMLDEGTKTRQTLEIAAALSAQPSIARTEAKRVRSQERQPPRRSRRNSASRQPQWR